MLKNKKGIIQRIIDNSFFKRIIVMMLLSFIFEIIRPTAALALTEGPSSPETQSFEPVTTTNMVNTFTGDFSYNIPLLNVPGPNGGYPLNISYHAGSTIEDEASWVGLGWNISVGSLNRGVRGVPDEFQEGKDFYERKVDRKADLTFGGNFGFGEVTQLEFLGAASEKLDGKLVTTYTSNKVDMYGPSHNFSMYYNNYSGIGVGYGIDLKSTSNDNLTFGFNFGSSGIGANIGLNTKKDGECIGDEIIRKYKFGFNLDGQLKLDYSLTIDKKIDVVRKIREGNYTKSQKKTKETTSYFSQGSSINYDTKGSFSEVGMSTIGWNLSLRLGTGTQTGITYNYKNFGLNFSSVDLVKSLRNGYSQDVNGYECLSNNELTYNDFAEKGSSAVSRTSKVLGNAYANFDVYSATGQGVVGAFRPVRNDIQNAFPVGEYSVSNGLSLGFQAGAGPAGGKLGVDPGVNFSWTDKGSWLNEKNTAYTSNNISSEQSDDERYFYKAFSEQTVKDKSYYDYYGGLDVEQIKIKSGIKPEIDANTVEHDISGDLQERSVRNTTISSVKNSEAIHLGEYQVLTYELGEDFFTEPDNPLNRQKRKMNSIDVKQVDVSHHHAGYSTISENGERYVYALPVYNNIEVNNLFSTAQLTGSETEVDIDLKDEEIDYKVNGTYKYNQRTAKSPYPVSYLLTCVLGADYVDLTNDGPTDDDLGYWVKFEYQKVHDDFKWRSPYESDKAFPSKGLAYTKDDDMASYTYGEKEIWYLARVKTASHIAIFETSKREDYLQSEGEYKFESNATDKESRKLDKISVYLRKDFTVNSTPLNVVEFDYDYSVISNVPNSTNGGKLTLKSIEFSSMGSSKSIGNKYAFEYNNNTYKKNALNSWGQERYVPSDNEISRFFPYVSQFKQGWIEDPSLTSNDEVADDNHRIAGLNNLSKITLPSGGEINVKYEIDDYAFVQNVAACQMYKIMKVNDGTISDNFLYDDDCEFLGESNDVNRRIYFNLEEPLPLGYDDGTFVKENYIDPLIDDGSGGKSIYFKVNARVGKFLGNEVYDVVSGYLPIKTSSESCGVSNGLGYITLKEAVDHHDKKLNFHPLSLAVWSFMQSNMSELVFNPNSFDFEDVDENNIVGKSIDIINILPQVMSSIGMMRRFCKMKDFGKVLNLNKSCIRLPSADKKKFGGGHRVSSIELKDNWNGTGGEVTYGNVYDYTIKEGDNEISSGVATYEPQLGGDENSLKTPIYRHDRISVFNTNSTFDETPVNSELFPSPTVGYRKVSIKTINTKEQLDNQAPNSRTSGVKMFEYYTAKDFPVKAELTELVEDETYKYFNLPIPIPLIGQINRKFYTGVQSFLLETNNMHGKLKKISEFGLTRSNGAYSVESNPYAFVKYEYQVHDIKNQEVVNGRVVEDKLKSNVTVVENINSFGLNSTDYLMGVDAELAVKQSEIKSLSSDQSIDFNVDNPIISVLSFWPSLNNNKIINRQYVTNKVINRSGILKKVITKTPEKVVSNEIIAYDSKAGIPIITASKNDFQETIYNYSIPAYYEYSGMSFASDNINAKIENTIVNNSQVQKGDDVSFYLNLSTNQINLLEPGDELIVKGSDNTLFSNAEEFKKVFFLGLVYNSSQTYGKFLLLDGVKSSFDNLGISDEIRMQIIRSGKRNQFGQPIANYTVREMLNTNLSSGVISDGVLSASVSLFKDSWFNNGKELDSEPFEVENPYENGTKGIWRSYKSLTYAGLRSSDLSIDNPGSEPNSKDAGYMSNVSFYDYDLGYYENIDPIWFGGSEVNGFNKHAYPNQNINKLNLRSSALYGFDEVLKIMTSGNANQYEIGMEDFEYQSKGTSTQDFSLAMEKNLAVGRFTSNSQGINLPERLKIKSAKIETGIYGKLKVVVDYPWAEFDSKYSYDKVGMELISKKNTVLEGNEHFYVNANLRWPGGENFPSDFSSAQGNSNETVLYYEVYRDEITMNNTSSSIFKNGSEFVGDIVVSIEAGEVSSSSADVVVTDEISHSGYQSLKINSPVSFGQSLLKLETNKPYVFSCWISMNDLKQKDVYSSILVNLKDAITNSNQSITSVITGNVIEGWQKVDIEFEFDDVAYNGQGFVPISLIFDPNGNDLFVDDIRISPKKSGAMSYVYDPIYYRLNAGLGVDNFAGFNYYDEEGNLVMTKMETNQGVFTNMESRGNLKK